MLGHEFAGEVVALGKCAEGLSTGDLVAVIPLHGCGACEPCRAGEYAWCDRFGLQGGGYAEYALTTSAQCVVLPRSASRMARSLSRWRWRCMASPSQG